MSTAARVLDVARSQLGYAERPGNRTKFGAWYGMDGQPWCAMWVSWVADQAGAAHLIPRHAYTPTGAGWFQARGAWHGSGPRPGDVAYFWSPSMGRIAHVGLVEAVLPDGRVVTLEGNADAAGSRTGGSVVRLHRAPARPPQRTGGVHITGYGRPAYAAAPAPPPPPQEDEMSAADVAQLRAELAGLTAAQNATMTALRGTEAELRAVRADVRRVEKLADRGQLMRLFRIGIDPDTGVRGAAYKYTGSEINHITSADLLGRLVADEWPLEDAGDDPEACRRTAQTVDDLAAAADQESPRWSVPGAVDPTPGRHEAAPGPARL